MFKAPPPVGGFDGGKPFELFGKEDEDVGESWPKGPRDHRWYSLSTGDLATNNELNSIDLASPMVRYLIFLKISKRCKLLHYFRIQPAWNLLENGEKEREREGEGEDEDDDEDDDNDDDGDDDDDAAVVVVVAGVVVVVVVVVVVDKTCC